jgi:phosphoenolpyruvate carboxylase
MHDSWPFFTSFLENAELSLAKADLPVAELYLELGGDPDVSERIRAELALTTELVLAVTQHDAPLAGKPVLRRAVDLRNPYVDALSFLQVRFLRESRDTADPTAERVVHLTISGVAAGLQNTG